ncbi:MAG TPA: hypothetical protein VGL53_21025 [Bryobacteraceae bacterium]|jgi:uncharacterized protein involved in exopolysaccharide biosynthesis
MHAQLQENGHGDRTGGDRWIDVAKRRRGWILGCAFAGLVLSVVGSYLWPDTYRSSATLQLNEPSSAGGVAAADERIRKLVPSVESRIGLESMIGMYDLYPNERKHLPIEDVVENMKRSTHVTEVAATANRDQRTSVAAFQISFDYSDRVKAQKVVRDLAARFLSEVLPSQMASTSAAMAPAADLNDPTETAKKDLEAADAKLDDFRTAHVGLLPEQEEANQQKMTELETHRSRVQSDLARVKSEQSDLETQLASQQEKRRGIKEYVDVPAPPRAPSKQLTDYDKQIQTLEQRIKTLKEQYTDKFPDVIDTRQKLADVRAKRDSLAKQEAASAPGPTRKADPEAQRVAADVDTSARNTQAQIAAKVVEAGDLNKEAAEVDEDIQAMKTRFKNLPDSEKQYADLLRDRDLKKTQLEEAEIKSQAMRAGQQAQQPARGESILLIDAPSMPSSPMYPNRPLLIGGGTLIGLLIGFILGAARELRSAPALAGTPAISAGASTWLIWSVAIVLGVAAMAAAMGYYYTTYWQWFASGK